MGYEDDKRKNDLFIPRAYKHHEHYTREELIYILNSPLATKQIARRLGRTPKAIDYAKMRLRQRGIEGFNTRRSQK